MTDGTTRRNRRLGFTLVELMAVVTIVGILAAVGVVLMRKHVFGSKRVEALSMLQSIRAAQERWRAENQSYLDVSDAIDAWYPMEGAEPNATYYGWGGGNDAMAKRWKLLNVTVTGNVQFGYATKAGTAFNAVTQLTTREKPTWPDANGPWYVIQAKGDADGNGIASMYAASSLNDEIYIENEGE